VRSTPMRFAAAAIPCCALVIWGANQVAAQRRTPVTVTRLYTGSDSQTHVEQVDMKLIPSALSDGTERSDRIKVTAMQIVRQPPGHVNDWHNASQTPLGHQYVITISGRGEVEVAGGQRVQLGPGQILLGEDLTGKGHITRAVGSEDWVSLHISILDQ